MQKVTLPNTDIDVSPVCVGCWQFNAGKSNVNWEAQSLDESKAIVDKALEIGINFFDTAEGYGGSEEVLGQCLAGKRRDAVIATKYGFRDGINTLPYSAVQIDEAVTRSMQKLQTDYIDIMQIHLATMVGDAKEAVDELNRQIQLGRIKAYGVSNFGPKNMRTFLDGGGKPATNQMGYNLLWRSIEDEVLPICVENNISILAYSPLQQGLLTGKFATVSDVPEGRRRTRLFNKDSAAISRHGGEGCEKEVFETIDRMRKICSKANISMTTASLSWIIQQPNVPVVIVGAKTPAQIQENSAIVQLSQAVIKELNDASEEVKKMVGGHLDPWADRSH